MTPAEIQQIKSRYAEAKGDLATMAEINSEVLITLLEHQMKEPQPLPDAGFPRKHTPEEAERILSRLKTSETAKETFPAFGQHPLVDALAVVEERDQLVSHIVMGPKVFGDVRKHMRDIFDPETRTMDVRLGFQGYIWGALVFVTKKAEGGYFYLLGEHGSSSEPGDTIRFLIER